jgi:hypothetical protein
MQWWLWFDIGWDPWKHFASPLSWSSDAKDCKPYLLIIDGYLICLYWIVGFYWICFYNKKYDFLYWCYVKVKCLNSLGVSDLMHQYILRTQKMSLLGKDMQYLSFVASTMIISIIHLLPHFLFAAVYLPPSAITVHHLVAQVQRPNIEWPKSYQRSLCLYYNLIWDVKPLPFLTIASLQTFRSRTMWLEKMETLKSWHYKIPPYISRHLSTKSFVEDLISPLLHILSPPTLRPVTYPHLFRFSYPVLI